MDDNKKKRLNNTIRVLSLVFLALVIIILIWAMYKGKLSSIMYSVLICCTLFVFWLLNDVICPIVTQEFAEHTPEQMSAYRVYALLNLAGYGGLAYFGAAVGTNTGIYGAFVYVIAMMFKRKYLNQYMGIEEDGEEADSSSDAEETDADSDGQIPEIEEPDPAEQILQPEDAEEAKSAAETEMPEDDGAAKEE